MESNEGNGGEEVTRMGVVMIMKEWRVAVRAVMM